MSSDHRQALTDLNTMLQTMDHDEQENFPGMEEGHNDDYWVRVPDPDGEDYAPAEPAQRAESSSEAPEEWVPTEAEKDAAAVARLRDLNPPAAKVAKRPRSPGPPEDVVPDLAEIFDNYDTPHATRISICRAYASYIASLQPKKPKKAASRRR